jgi:hypothetical protein
MIIVKPEKNDSSNIYGICAKNTYILLIFLIFVIDSFTTIGIRIGEILLKFMKIV